MDEMAMQANIRQPRQPRHGEPGHTIQNCMNETSDWYRDLGELCIRMADTIKRLDPDNPDETPEALEFSMLDNMFVIAITRWLLSRVEASDAPVPFAD